MERSDSTSSNGTNKSGAASAGPFAYQTRLLERTASTRGTGALPRSSSLSGKAVFGTPNPAAVTGGSTRRWAPSHRVGNSLDTVRGKWEERAKAEAALEGRASPTTPSAPMDTGETVSSTSSSTSGEGEYSRRFSEYLQSSTANRTNGTASEAIRPTYAKRRSLPPPIIASALSPNTTGLTVENPDTPTSHSHRIHLPASAHPQLESSSLSHVKGINGDTIPEEEPIRTRRPSQYRRSTALDGLFSATSTESTTSSESSSGLSRDTHEAVTPTPVRRRPTSLYNSLPTTSSLINKFNNQAAASSAENGGRSQPAAPIKIPSKSPSTSVPPSPITSSVMSPPVYRSPSASAATDKKVRYGEHLTAGRKLGKHLPRIASGDGDETWEEDVSVQKKRRSAWEAKSKRVQELQTIESALVPGGVGDTEDVAGIPGRLRLSRDRSLSAPKIPLPSSRLTRGLWADVQRHLLQAYEYLCHVGEAQQWIEGCLGEELGFGVVEMEERMRNGVVLARLARVFQGEAVVRRIYEAPKLDFRHSDNINHFLSFSRHVGLPECFVFELTDLYEKKNVPKVIYCIHALSHLLARRGLAERIGNLLGQLQFSDDQLAATQKGLNAAGVPMPNFGNVGRELAKEINEEPEAEVETEDERRDRLLLENEKSIVALQSQARAFLVRKAIATQRVRLRLAERYVPKLQAHCRGVLVRRMMAQERKAQTNLTPWITALQTVGRATIARRRWLAYVRRIHIFEENFVKVQAQARGLIQRRRFAHLKAAMRRATISVVKLQSLARAKIAQRSHKQLTKSFSRADLAESITNLQAHARGVITRRNLARRDRALLAVEPYIVALQAHARGVLMRRRMRTQLTKLQDVTHVVVRIQAAVRTYLARKRLLNLIRGLRRATPVLVGFQARARGAIKRQRHQDIVKHLSQANVITSVGGFQAFARAALARQKRQEQKKQLEFVMPDVVCFQAAARGALVRQDYYAWRDHIWRNEAIAIIMQAMLRGVLQRRLFRAKMRYFRENLDKVVKIQSLFRGKETREQYRQLTLGKNVNVNTIKNFVHLLDDSEADFQEEIKVEQLRKKVVENIRENQALENDVNELDVRIALVVQNVKSFEELVKARRRHGADSAAAHAARASVLAAHGDPFAGPATLDAAAKRKLELYQQLFYVLQTRGEYLSKLFVQMSRDDALEKDRRLSERVVLTLFGYGQDRREDYLLLKLFQLSIQEETLSSKTISDLMQGHPMYIHVAVHYVRPKQVMYARETLQRIVREVIDSDDLNLEIDASVIYRTRLDLEEMRSGAKSSKPRDIPFYQALENPETRVEYIHHLQLLQWWTQTFLDTITQSTKRLPYAIRYLARQTLTDLRERFPDAPEEAYSACIGRLVYYRYLNPAILTPETFDIVSSTVDIAARKNLAQISRVLTQISAGVEFGDDNPCYVPINDFVKKAIKQMHAWFIEVADVPDAETQFHAHEFLDATVQPKPIYISPNEIYAMHSLLSDHVDFIAPSPDDALREILHELGGVPYLGDEALKDARDSAITLELTNRFARVRDPRADEKALWVQAKRGVLAILRVQPAKDLVESLMQPVTEEHEKIWVDILENEMISDQERSRSRRQMPSTTGYESGYRLEDIRSLSFREVKAHAIYFLLELEKLGKITRADGYQGILNAIAGDVRSKHRKRLARQQEMENMMEALKHLRERKKYFEEQIDTYNKYVEMAMSTMQRGKSKKRFVIPFTKQYFHLRELQKSGKTPQFGSFKYSAQDLYDKGILLSIDQFSPRQFDKIDIVISSNEVGVFTIDVFNNGLGITNRVASQDLRMEDLLQAQYENRASLSLCSGLAKVNLNLLLYQINKKFYV